MKIFNSANILLPKTSSYHKWAVVACDQYSSNPDYWNRVHEAVQDEPSTLQVILPEAWLGTDREKSHQEKIRPAMEAFLKQKLLKEYPDSFIYVERTLADGTIRQGWLVPWIWKLMTIIAQAPFRSGRLKQPFLSGFRPGLKSARKPSWNFPISCCSRMTARISCFRACSRFVSSFQWSMILT